MEIHAIPFGEQFIIYRPLRRLAFIGNAAMVRHVQERDRATDAASADEVDAFLDSIGFWEPDPPAPQPWNPSGEHRPTMAVLLMTTACNLRCTYCYARGGEGPPKRMPLQIARKAIDAAHENARIRGREQFAVAFHGGGEPTLHWDVLTAAVEHARAKDLPCDISMSTNGVWTDEQRDFILASFTGLSLSFDGIPEVQNLQRPRASGNGSFDAVMESLHALDARELHYGIRMTVTPASSAALPESVALLCEETQCPIMQVEPCYATQRGEYSDPTREQADAFVAAFLSAFEIAARRGRTLLYSGARPWAIANCFCRAPEESLVVTADGDVVTCFETYDRRHPLMSHFTIGRVTADGVQTDIGALRAFSARQAERRTACEGCFCYWHCGGDCAAKCMASPGRSRGRCRANRAITRELLAWYIAAGDGVWHGELPGECGPNGQVDPDPAKAGHAQFGCQ